MGISPQEIKKAKDSGNYLEIARIIEKAAMQDVINNSNKQRIEMSQGMAEKLYSLRQKNNHAIVNKVTRETESNVIPMAIKNIVWQGKNILVTEGVISKLEECGKFQITDELIKKYEATPHLLQILEFAEGINEEDYNFTAKIADERKTLEDGKKVNKDEAIAALITAQFIANMDDLQFVKYLRESGNLAVEQEKDLHVKYNKIPGILTDDSAPKSDFMKRIAEQQDAALQAIMLEEDDGRDD